MTDLLAKLTETVNFLQDKIEQRPVIGIILGSGLGNITEVMQVEVAIPYAQIPHFPVSTVQGHHGQLIFGKIGQSPVLVMQGRFHYYEGYNLNDVTYPIRVMQHLGVEQLIITNAAGGLNPEFRTGDLMLISDHINFMGYNPLIGRNYDEIGPRFPPLTDAYDPVLQDRALQAAKQVGVKLQSGVYIAVSGPSYETPAELRMFRQWGADAVGMSTVPEVIVARHGGIKVLGISCITNVPLAEVHTSDTHQQVVNVANAAGPQLFALIRTLLGEER